MGTDTSLFRLCCIFTLGAILLLCSLVMVGFKSGTYSPKYAAATCAEFCQTTNIKRVALRVTDWPAPRFDFEKEKAK